MIISANSHDSLNDVIPTHAPSLEDIASLRLEMRTCFHELSECLKLVEIEQAQLANKFDALLSLMEETQRR